MTEPTDTQIKEAMDIVQNKMEWLNDFREDKHKYDHAISYRELEIIRTALEMASKDK